MNDDLKEFADILFAPRERDELKQRIDKAIEYLKENADYDGDEFCGDLRYDYCEELLDILKGSDSNE